MKTTLFCLSFFNSTKYSSWNGSILTTLTCMVKYIHITHNSIMQLIKMYYFLILLNWVSFQLLFFTGDNLIKVIESAPTLRGSWTLLVFYPRTTWLLIGKVVRRRIFDFFISFCFRPHIFTNILSFYTKRIGVKPSSFTFCMNNKGASFFFFKNIYIFYFFL